MLRVRYTRRAIRAPACAPSAGSRTSCRYSVLPRSRGSAPAALGHVALLGVPADSPERIAVALGEGDDSAHESAHIAHEVGVAQLWVKDEGLNPTASFKARGMSMAVTRAKALGVPGLVVPTAGNAGIALAAYGAAARHAGARLRARDHAAPILAHHPRARRRARSR